MGDIQAAPFYPLNLFFYLLSPMPALYITTFVHLFLAQLFFHLFMGEVGVSRGSAIASSIVFSLSGFFVVNLHHLTFLPAGVWLPLMLYLFERYRKGGWTGLIPLCGIITGFSILAGSPQISHHALAFFLLYGAVSIFRPGGGRGASPRRVAGFLVPSLMGGLLLSAATLLPFGEVFLSGPSPFDEGGLPSPAPSSPLNLLRILIPDLFGNPFVSGFRARGTYWDTWVYAGIFPLFLFFVCFRRGGARVWFFIFGTIASLLAVSFYPGNPIASILTFPFRAPGRFFYITLFSLSFLTGRGLDALMAGGEGREGMKRGGDIFLLLFVGFFIAGGVVHLLMGGSFLPEAKRGFLLLLLNLLLPGLGLRFLSKEGRGRFLPAAAVFILLVDYIPISLENNRDSPAGMQGGEEAARLIQGDGGTFRVFNTTGSPDWLINSGMAEGYRNVRGYNPMNSHRYFRFLSEGARGQARGRITAHVEGIDLRWLSLLNTRYIIAAPGDEVTSGFEPLHEMKGGLLLFKNRGPHPAAFFTTGILVEPEPEEGFAILKGMKDPREKVLLEEPPPFAAEEGELVVRLNIEVRHRGSRIEAHLPPDLPPGVLILSETLYPGWKAFAHGEERGVVRCDYLFIGIFLKGGEREVEFVYHPLSFRAGLLVSLATFVTLSLFYLIPLSRR